MTREKRLIVSVVAIGLVGIAALGVLARQLGSRVPQKSVHDLPPAATPGPDLSSPTPPAPASAPSAAGPEQAAPPSAALLVEGFLAGRKAAAAVIARYPIKFKSIAAALSGDYASMKGVRTGIEVNEMATYKVERYEAFAAAGLGQADYERVRAAWRSWRSGGRVDSALAEAFEENRQALTRADLGPYERLDDEVK
jgi:hypothetical protein